jgi:hypothetical protein
MSDTTKQTPGADKTTEHTGQATTAEEAMQDVDGVDGYVDESAYAPTEPHAAEVAAPTPQEQRACTLDAHDWITKRNDNGDFYETCSHCGKQADWLPQPVAPPS